MAWPSLAVVFLPGTRSGRIRPLVFVGLAVLVAGTALTAWRVWQAPAVRERVALAAVVPVGGVIPFETMPGLRVWAARELAARQTPAALLAAVRLLNTIEPEADPVFAAKILDPLRRAAGQPGAGGEWNVQLAAINRWVAARVGRSVDGHEGVLGWFAVAQEFQPTIETIAGADPQAGWRAWSGFGAGTLTTSEAFLYAVGRALSDPRPIAFSLRRTSAPGSPLRVEALPEPPAGDAQVRTVGEALALRLWQYQGIAGGTPSEDFGLWWAGFARRRLLPPPGAGAF